MSVQAQTVQPPGWFQPSNSRTVHIPGDTDLFRCKSGRFSQITQEDLGWRQKSTTPYSEATVYSGRGGEIATDHLLAVNLDATTVDLPHNNNRWGGLQFRDVTEAPGRIRSKVDVTGLKQEIAAPGPRHLVKQVIPSDYDFEIKLDQQSNEIRPTNTFTGLIGNMSILIAMAAFSAPQLFLKTILENHLRLGRWLEHQHPTGRKYGYDTWREIAHKW